MSLRPACLAPTVFCCPPFVSARYASAPSESQLSPLARFLPPSLSPYRSPLHSTPRFFAGAQKVGAPRAPENFLIDPRAPYSTCDSSSPLLISFPVAAARTSLSFPRRESRATVARASSPPFSSHHVVDDRVVAVPPTKLGRVVVAGLTTGGFTVRDRASTINDYD